MRKCKACDGTGYVLIMERPAGQTFSEERGTIIEDEITKEEECDVCDGTGQV